MSAACVPDGRQHYADRPAHDGYFPGKVLWPDDQEIRSAVLDLTPPPPPTPTKMIR